MTFARKFAIFLASFALAGCATIDPVPSADTIQLRVVGINDFHGNLEPLARPMGIRLSEDETVRVPVAGAAWLAGAIDEIRAESKNTLVISAGDLIGGSPLVSSIFLDEPTIGVMNRLGLDFNAVGNHEFDRGWQELKRMQDGGCDKLTMREPCAVEDPFTGAEFTFLAANVVTPDNRTLFPAYGTRIYGEGEDAVRIAVIGLTLEETPTLVTPSGVAGLRFLSEARTINSLIPQIRSLGIETIILSIHQGLYSSLPYAVGGCEGIEGPLLAILAELDPAIDLVHSGHTHQSYVCDYASIDPERQFLVTSGGYGGSYLTDVTLTIDRDSGDVIGYEGRNRVIQSEGVDREGNPLVTDARLDSFAPTADMAGYVAQYVEAARGASERSVGRISDLARKGGPPTEETPLGNLIADAQLEATRSAGAQIALMNNSGVRGDLVPRPSGEVSYGDIFTVQPFGNTLVTRSYSGAQLLALLEQQFDDTGFIQTFSISDGFSFAYDLSQPLGNRVKAASLNGAAINPAVTYRVTMNSFLAAGGDSFTIFTEGSNSVTGPVDLDAFEAYLRRVEVAELPETGRITDQTPSS
ncbi:bifunctional metallophosphatase/5'-nucleotidase [Altererythrobacter sp. MF3-039]|uniref:bifunctional metallophosphatase/5'-nucleotidase n=1 Tax=Altererythrobacter sp. MF3-039 TaxID=3252901 RepID=UPI00390CB9CF